jgi:alpha-L-fucosidase
MMLLSTTNGQGQCACRVQLPARRDTKMGDPSTDLPQFAPNWDSLSTYVCPDWFRDAKFGIWAHWSPQCVPEYGDWYARSMYLQGRPAYEYHVAHYGHPSTFGYKDICNLWHAEKWQPEQLMQRYQRAGAKYFVALANHHCNFDCWDSKHHNWNSVRVGPKKDIVGGRAAAARAHGLRFAVTVHTTPARTWRQFFPVTYGSDQEGPLKGVPYDGNLTKADGKGTWWDGLDPQDLYCPPHPYGSDPDPEFVRTFLLRVYDLVDSYHPDLLYFDDALQPVRDLDTTLGMQDTAPQIASYFYNANRKWHDGRLEAVLNIKDVPAELQPALVQDMERLRAGRTWPYPWQTDTCIGHWHYRRDSEYRTARSVVLELVDIVSKNGNMLLNIPIRGDGSIDECEVAFLDGLTAWMDVNGEALFGTRPWRVYGEGPDSSPQDRIDTTQQDSYTAEDIRFTAKGSTLYALLLDWPVGEAVIRSLGNGRPVQDRGIAKIQMLGVAGDLPWRQDDAGLHVRLPDRRPCDHAYALKITLH